MGGKKNGAGRPVFFFLEPECCKASVYAAWRGSCSDKTRQPRRLMEQRHTLPCQAASFAVHKDLIHYLMTPKPQDRLQPAAKPLHFPLQHRYLYLSLAAEKTDSSFPSTSLWQPSLSPYDNVNSSWPVCKSMGGLCLMPEFTVFFMFYPCRFHAGNQGGRQCANVPAVWQR